MLGFNPFSDSPISGLPLQQITGTISADDQNDTANIQAAIGSVTTASINATDQTDSADITATVAFVTITATISVTDQNDTANIQAQVQGVAPTIDTHDGFTREEIRRARELDKKIEKARRKLEEAKKNQKLARKQAIRELVDPESVVAKIQQNDVESRKLAKDNSLAELIKASAAVKRLELQRQELLRAIGLKQEQARIQTELAILKAKELDDEETILALLL